MFMKKDRNFSFSFVMFPFTMNNAFDRKKENVSGEKHYASKFLQLRQLSDNIVIAWLFLQCKRRKSRSILPLSYWDPSHA